MTLTPKRPRDTNQLAKMVVDIATGQKAEKLPNAAAQDDGHRGGVARAANLSAERKAEIARAASRARWGDD